MKRILILGSSPTGVEIIRGIRQHDPVSEITLLLYDQYYPVKREFLPDYIKKGISKNELFCEGKGFYERNKINVIFDAQINRINFKKNKVFLEGQSTLEYDILIITEMPLYRLPSIKGANKTDVVGLGRLKDIERVLKGAPFAETILVEAQSMWGIEMAVSLAQRVKEVVLVLPPSHFIFTQLDPEALKGLLADLEGKGIRVVHLQTIKEILGDSDVRAVRLESAKVLAAEMVLFDQVEQDFRFLAESPLIIDQKIVIDNFCKTNLENVYACDVVAQSSQRLEIQGEIIAAVINGKEVGEGLQDTQLSGGVIIKNLS